MIGPGSDNKPTHYKVGIFNKQSQFSSTTEVVTKSRSKCHFITMPFTFHLISCNKTKQQNHSVFKITNSTTSQLILILFLNPAWCMHPLPGSNIYSNRSICQNGAIFFSLRCWTRMPPLIISHLLHRYLKYCACTIVGWTKGEPTRQRVKLGTIQGLYCRHIFGW